jgi:hypothetical protein
VTSDLGPRLVSSLCLTVLSLYLYLLATVLVFAGPVGAQQPGADSASRSTTVIDGSPAPVLPASITRDERGRATVRAIRLDEPLTLDGVLDEDMYSDFQPFGDFVQVTPVAGDPSSQRTDVWIGFDDENIYVTCRCWDDAPPGEWIVNELRRDADGIRNNEHFGIMFDTFYDRRNGFMLYANPLGARNDYAVVDESTPNRDWNPLWDVAPGRFDGGWTVEIAIPFKSLRYRSGLDQMWGLQLRRSIRHLNEWTYLNPVPAFMAGPQALNQVSAAGTVVGLDLPPAGSNVELKPYGIAGATTDRVAMPSVSNRTADTGLDLKYGLTANLTADLTFNTDFAQVEVDEQQVNLTRFSLFFPEKREFFLEGRGVFDFGTGGSGGFGGGGRDFGGGGFGRGGGDTPSLFYSRRIGFQDGAVIPIQAGGRVTGKVGPWTIGLMNIHTGGDDGVGVSATDFSVVRFKRDILGRSAIGAMFTNRSIGASGTGFNRVYGMDATFAFFTNLQIGGYYARTETPALTGDDESYQARFNYSGDKYGASGGIAKVGDDFNPEIGFLRRSDFRKSSGSLRFSPRPISIEAIRKFTWQATVNFFEDGAGEMESRNQQGRFSVEFENSDQFALQATRNFERLDEPFEIDTHVDIPQGRYTYTGYQASYNFGTHRRVSGNVSYQWGDFFNGSIRTLSINRARVVVSDHLSLEPGVSLNLIDLPVGESNQTVFRLRADYSFTPRMFASTLLQYNESSSTFSSNVRFRWEYRPGSEFFVVWTDEHDTGIGGTGLRNRALTLKLTRLLRF